ncbi:MAG: DUF5979 domain-containing protein, partial [Oscillospiraceae bacterium]|nr:DUF5979 domain-containing protein [Oscillospiraceae bacterium]
MTAVKRPAPQMIFLYKSICALLALIFLCSAVVSGTMAWRDATQHKTNNVRGKYVPEEEPREGELTITKQVTVDSGQLTVDHLTREFEFIVNFYNIENGQSVIDTDCEYTYKIDGGTAQKIKSGGEIKLKHGQKAVITGLPKGKLYTVTETPAAGYTTTSVNNQGNAIVGNITAAFTNTFQTPKSGSLKITKQVTGDSGQLTVEQTEKKFNFTVDLILPADTVLPLTITVNGQPKQLSTVTCQLSTELRHDESVLISNLPAGTKYTVAEDDYSTDGYTATIDEYEGEIIGETELPLPFVNVHGGDGEDGSLTITKTVTGVSGDKNKLFNFTVDLILPADTVLPITITVNGQEKQLSTVTCQLSTELRHSESMVISNLPAGTEYTVAEDDYSGDDYATDVQNATGTIAGNETAAVSVTN